MDGDGGVELCGTNGNPALRFRVLALAFLTELSVLIQSWGIELGGWLPVSLTEFGHRHGFSKKCRWRYCVAPAAEKEE